MIKQTIYIILFILTGITGFSQEEQPVEKSQIVENIDGKDYYLHFVKKGETLYTIAHAYDISVNEIFRVNPESKNGIQPGNILKIPVSVKPEPDATKSENKEEGYFYHIVKKQETYYGIARKYGITIDELKKLNPQSGDYPREGETLKIPVKKTKTENNEESWEGITVQHTVEAGETLYGIAKKYNVTTGEIINANPGTTSTLTIGEVLEIPNQVQPIVEDVKVKTGQSGDDRYTEHIVLKGETLYQIAREYGVGIDSLKKHNPGLSSDLNPGQTILVPKKGTTKSYIIHHPEKKEKLDEIAFLYDVNYEEISKINPDINRKAKKGQQVRIPVEPEPKKGPDTLEIANLKSLNPLNNCMGEPAGKTKTFNVALMLPFFLEELDSLTLEKERDIEWMTNLSSFRFMDFYAGFKMAVDSMQQKGMKLNLFVYDVDNTEEKTDKVLQLSELSSMDLIIGPLYSKSFAKVAKFAKTYEIPIVNPLSEREEVIYGNPYVYKIRPSEEDQLDKLVSYLGEHYPRANIVLVRHNKYKYQSQISYIRNKLNTERPGHIYIPNTELLHMLNLQDAGNKLLTENKLLDKAEIRQKINDSTFFTNLVKEVIYLDDSITGLKMNLSKARKNIVIAISDDIVFSKQLLSELNKLSLDHQIVLFGLPNWKKYDDLESQQLLNLHFHCYTYSAVDYNNPNVQQWIESFRDKYKTEPTPDNFAFDGFDTGWYFLNALYKFGNNFNQCLQFMDVALIQTRFEFNNSPGNGHRNTFWNLGKYEDYKFRKIFYSSW